MHEYQRRTVRERDEEKNIERERDRKRERVRERSEKEREKEGEKEYERTENMDVVRSVSFFRSNSLSSNLGRSDSKAQLSRDH